MAGVGIEHFAAPKIDNTEEDGDINLQLAVALEDFIDIVEDGSGAGDTERAAAQHGPEHDIVNGSGDSAAGQAGHDNTDMIGVDLKTVTDTGAAIDGGDIDRGYLKFRCGGDRWEHFRNQTVLNFSG